MSKESIQGPLSALRNAGTVCGVCLVRGPEILVNLFPFSEARINDMVSAIDEIQLFFAQKGRNVDQMSFGYDGGCLCIVEDDEFRLVVMHMLADEVDFIAKAARAFLADFHLDLFAEHFAAGNTRLEGFVTRNEAPASLREGEAVPASPLEAIRSRQEESATAPPPVNPATVELEIEEEENRDSEGIVEEEDEEAMGTEAIEFVGLDSEESESEDFGNTTGGAKLAENQPESTLPPQRRPSQDL